LNLPRVMIGMPIGSGSIPWPTAVSLMSTLRACDKENVVARISAPTGSSVVTWARSAVVGEFLKSDCTHLFWIDSDIAWKPADFFRLVGFAALHDMIGAAYMLKKEPAQCVVNVPVPGEYEVNGLGNVRVKSLAMGFTICKREVIEKVAATKPVLKDALAGIEYPDFFRLGRRADGYAVGEDIAFFEDAAELGFKAWLDPSINLFHVGQKLYGGDVIDALGLQEFVKEKQA
jgi:hypothetical protein